MIDFSKLVTAEMKAAETRETLRAAVDVERDRRIDGGFGFAGIEFQSRPQDRENIAGAATAALASLLNGYEWPDDFAWIAADNTLVPMDAETMFAFGQAAMAHKQEMIFRARALKDAENIPEDFTDDKYWSD